MSETQTEIVEAEVIEEEEKPLSTELVAIVDPIGLEQQEAHKIARLFNEVALQLTDWEQKEAEIEVTSEDQKDKMALAKALRTEIKNARVATKKIKEDIKAEVNARGKVIDKCFNFVTDSTSAIEKRLEKKEKYAFYKEQERLDKRSKERHERIAEYWEVEDEIPGIRDMPDEMFDMALAGYKKKYEDAIAAEQEEAIMQAAEEQQAQQLAAENEALKAELDEKNAEIDDILLNGITLVSTNESILAPKKLDEDEKYILELKELIPVLKFRDRMPIDENQDIALIALNWINKLQDIKGKI